MSMGSSLEELMSQETGQAEVPGRGAVSPELSPWRAKRGGLNGPWPGSAAGRALVQQRRAGNQGGSESRPGAEPGPQGQVRR